MVQLIGACTVAARRLNDWKRLTRKGNQAYATGHMEQALVDYQAALFVARILVGSQAEWDSAVSVDQAESAIVALVVSQHNLADYYTAQQAPGTAAEHLCQAHEAVYALLAHPAHRVGELTLRYLHVTGVELMSFIQRFGGIQRTRQTLQLACQASSPLSMSVH